MKYSEWRIWLRSLPWSLRWFPILVVIRPIVDQFWNLKSISPLISPLYWVGILTPILCIAGIRKFKQETTAVSSTYGKWSTLAIINASIVFIMHIDINYLILILKLTLPIYLFYFLRVFMVNKQDLKGILTSFLYAWGIVVALFVYELIFGARSIEVTRHTLQRSEGGFADVLNYALYAVSGFIVLGYSYFNSDKKRALSRLLPAIIGLILGLLILGKIYHTTSFIAIACLVALSLFRIFSDKPSVGIAFTLIIIVAYIAFGENLKKEAFDPLVAGELEILQKGEVSYRQFNGRMGRWMNYWGYFQQGNLVGKIFGSGIGLFGNANSMGIAVHNDFLRITFFSGFVGAGIYLFFFIRMLMQRRYMDNAERFLLEASVLMLFIYSMTTLPTMYAPYMYFLMTVFAYASLPTEHLLEADEEDGKETPEI